ncbi:MAG: AAA family ATPase, partial [Bacteroidetes bacterium]|nr:AAA family ATPase [Bacteroidota bacterium]
MQKLIGRKRELSVLNSLHLSDKSEFVAMYGRRRVGKTFLIRSAFGQKFTFQVTGLANATLTQQLTNFHVAFQKVNPESERPQAADWFSAFQQLKDYLENVKDAKKVVFIDELPWFDTHRSGFVQGLEHFWNSWASARSDIILIVCGSASSWMKNKLINNKGGLHNRITGRIRLDPFTLDECEEYLQNRSIALDRYQITQLYMSLGGIPFYWDEVKPGLSAMQNIENICFSPNGLLRTEFSNLYRSLFSNSGRHQSIVNALATKSKGLSRDEIIRRSGLCNAGSTTRLLVELEECGFIRKYIPFGKKLRNSLY